MATTDATTGMGRPFTDAEYSDRARRVREEMARRSVDVLLVLEAETATGLPEPSRVAEIAELRPLIARAAAR